MPGSPRISNELLFLLFHSLYHGFPYISLFYLAHYVAGGHIYHSNSGTSNRVCIIVSSASNFMCGGIGFIILLFSTLVKAMHFALFPWPCWIFISLAAPTVFMNTGELEPLCIVGRS